MKRRSIGPSVSFFAFQDIITAVVGIFILITLILVLELTQRVEAASKPPVADTAEMTATIESLVLETKRLQVDYENRISQQSAVADLNEINREARSEELVAQLQALSEQLATTEDQIKQTKRRLKQEAERESGLLRESQELEVQQNEIANLKARIDELDEKSLRLGSKTGLIYRNTTDGGRSLCILTLEGSKIEVKDAASKSVQYFSGRDRIDQLETWLQNSNSSARHFLLLVRPKGAADFDAVQDQLRKNSHVFGFDVVSKDHQTELTFQWESQP